MSRSGMQWVQTLAGAVILSGLALAGFSTAVLSAPAAKAKKPAQPKLPDLKTPEDKLKFLEAIRASFPTIRSVSGTFTSADLDKISVGGPPMYVDEVERYRAGVDRFFDALLTAGTVQEGYAAAGGIEVTRAINTGVQFMHQIPYYCE